MKIINIAVLYHDLMNLYGETGNLTALKSALEKQKIHVKVDYLTKKSKINFAKYDIYLMGCGTEDAQEIVRKDILRYKEEFSKVIKKKTFIMTGNSYELFGNKINNNECLGIFDFNSKTIKTRIVGEQVNKTYVLKEPVIGFQNRGSINDNKENHLFEVIKGNANNKDTKYEGIHIYNFYGTYTIGPLLIRNPYLTDKIVADVLKEKNMSYKTKTDTTDYKAYEAYLKNFNISKDI